LTRFVISTRFTTVTTIADATHISLWKRISTKILWEYENYSRSTIINQKYENYEVLFFKKTCFAQDLGEQRRKRKEDCEILDSRFGRSRSWLVSFNRRFNLKYENYETEFRFYRWFYLLSCSVIHSFCDCVHFPLKNFWRY
jgi:hypothetical protein